ncbi:MAG: 16S rRNA (cytosine(967)-C(5))-methyltransferase RsmB [Cellvibrionaceae bacterium]
MSKVVPVRVQAALTLASVLQQKASLASLMAPASEQVAENERALLQELCFGTCRWQPQLQSIIGRLLEKPLKPKDTDIHALLLLGLYQIQYMRVPDHAAISTTVDACRGLKKPWAEKLLNGVLRRFQREKETLTNTLSSSPAFATAHPNWLRKQICNAWPEDADAIFEANNVHPPMTLRLKRDALNRDDYIAQLQKQNINAKAAPFNPDAVVLEQAVDVFKLPGFSDGLVSVQDEAAQLAADLVKLEGGERLLDACCAPGGKTGHLLELSDTLAQPVSELIALDLEQRRLLRVEENLTRLKKQATLICADGQDIDQWWDGKTFDRILLDAPCSATGVVRRHPDIKILRKATDIAKLAALQLALLKALWKTLKPGGRLVYATCSILPTENNDVIQAFIEQQEDAQHNPIDAAWGVTQDYGRQLFPQKDGHDGFYYACLTKAAGK